MADRSVSVSLTAQVNGYISGMQKAAAETRNMGSEAENLAKKKESFTSLGIAIGGIGALAAAGFASMVKATADFDAQMAQVQTLSHATAAEMTGLRNAALTMGQGIGFSATQVADAETELTKAGVSVKDQLGGALKGALDLAAAGQLNVADATSIAASAMTQFKLKGADVPHIADLLAAGADKALGSVQDLGEALKYVGPVSESLGVSIEQTTGVLAEFAQNGIIGEQAGTELRGVLLSLTAPSQLAAQTMEKYNINLYDAQGNFIGVDGAAQQLKKNLGPLDQATRNAALGQIFGNAQITAANVLYEGGAKAVDSWTNKVNDQGFAAEQASGKMNSLNGDLSKLKAALESAEISTGEGSTGLLRSATQGLTGLVSAYASASPVAKDLTLAVVGVTAAVGLSGGAFLVLVPKIAAAKAALTGMQVSGKSAGLAIGSLTAGITLATTVFALYANQQSKIANNASELLATLDQQTGAVTKNTRAYVAQVLAQDHAYEAAKKAGVGQKELTDAVSEGGDALDDVLRKIGKTNTFGGIFTGQSEAAHSAGQNIAMLSKSVEDSKKQFQDQKKATDDSSSSTASAGDAAAGASTDIDSLSSSSDTAAQSIENVSNALKDLSSPTLDARSAYRDYQAAIDAVTSSIKDNGTTLDDNTDKGRANEAALDAIASSTESYAGALYTQTGSQDQATKAMESGRNSLIAALGQYGITGAAAQQYADKILGTPKDWATAFSNNAGSSKGPVDTLKLAIESIPKTYSTRMSVIVSGAENVNATKNAVNGLAAAIQHAASVGASTPIVAHASSGNVAFASGGYVSGPGTGTSDSIDAKLSNGEFVFKAAAVDRLGLGFLNGLNSGKPRGYADGGLVTPNYAAAPSVYVSPAPAPVVEVTINGADISSFVDIRVDGKLRQEARVRSNGSRGR
ncbi:phage tail tape measure protein [Curtobacterium sp. MCBD17_013]|uniref:phage tail tape measure protein n=1 Tax=Curtobacterium sp. MCBD17_013 TaxID=2175668 RepID=UPI000DAA3597|nr:phage tail tape measure protein [Curtobacterium sp. MCBD17_013]PZF63341.1 phage tail tape measure protein [Curtobacterium sp. MCBD17_013]